MSDSIVLQLPLSEEYDALFAQAREQTNLRKCRCWFDRTAAIGGIRVEVTDRDIGIRYETKKGIIWYDVFIPKKWKRAVGRIS